MLPGPYKEARRVTGGQFLVIARKGPKSLGGIDDFRMTIFISGICGFVGSSLARWFKAKKCFARRR
jgi:hypothetical protein